MKIIFISVPTKFQILKEKMGITEELKTYNVEYWSTYYLYNKFDPYERKEIDEEKIIIFKKKKEILKEIDLLKSTDIVISTESFNYINLKIYSKIIEKKCKLILFYPENIPRLNLKNNFFKRIFDVKKINILLFKIINRLKMIFFQKKVDKFYNSLQNIIILYSGKKIKDELLQKINKNNIFIPIMSTDLIKYKSIKNLKTQDEMVFIDQNLSGHADFLLNGQKMIDTFEYYEKLNKIFDFLEKKFSAKVVIAARFSNPYLSKFKNRKIIQGNTMEEIKKSKLVIGHFSTALGAVTIEKKPLLLLITNNLPNENKLYIELFSKELGAQILSMDLEDSLPKEINLNINFEKYENYYKNYLYDGNEKMILTKDIILKLIKEV